MSERDYARGLELKYAQKLETDVGRQAFVHDYVALLLADSDGTHRRSTPPAGASTSQNEKILRRKLRGALERSKTAQKAQAEAERNNRILRRKLDASNAELRDARQTNVEMRRTLTQLRHSRTMKVGRLVSSPMKVLRSLRGAPPDPASSAKRQGPVGESLIAPAKSMESPSEVSGGTGTSLNVGVRRENTRADGRGSAEWLASGAPQGASLEVAPTRSGRSEGDAHAFAKEVNELWFRRGAITKPLELVDLWLSQGNELPESVSRLVPDMRAAKHWLEADLVVPARVGSPIYRPIRDKLLYCVNNAPTYSSNGYATRTRGVASGLLANGLDVEVVSRPGFPWNAGAQEPERRFEERLDGVDYVHYPPTGNGTSIQDNMDAATDAFLREARRARPEFIQAASDHLTAFPALVAARLAGVPFVYEVRGLWEYSRCAKIPEWEGSERFQLAVKLESLVACEAEHVFAITEQVAEVLRERGVCPDRISLLPNAIDPDRFMPIPADRAYAKKHNIDMDAVRIGFAGSMVDYEGLDDLIRAFHALTVERPDIPAQLILAGSGESENDLKQLVSSLGLSNSVRFLGRLPQDEIARLLSLFDVMPCPRKSVRVTELVSPLKPLEGFSTYSAVVLSAIAPNVDLAGPKGSRARLFEPGDVRGLSRVLAELCADPDARRDLCRHGRMWVLTERSWVAVCGRAMGVYRALVSGAEPAGVPLAGLRVGLIADEFTTETLTAECEVVPLSRSGWGAQLDRLDFVIVESAWEGNGGEWHRGVGRYDDEEFRDVRKLLHDCKARGIPTVFWNKEDPIHTKRFIYAAARCDSIFTTDADLIPYYRERAGADATILSLPFFAQPKIHNPLRGATEEDVDSFAYAGTYYGDRYPERTADLLPLLEAAKDVGLTIFDRQATNPDSPYKFPEALRESVVGTLPYDRVLSTYKTHVGHLNGNSIAASPTMFSRRVVEIAAAGGVVISTQSRAVSELFGDSFPLPSSDLERQGLLNLWFHDADARRAEAWRQMRAVLRRHTASDALALMARSVGIPVRVSTRPGWTAVVEDLDTATAESLSTQTVRPDIVYWSTASDEAINALGGIDNANIASARIPAGSWVAQLDGPVPASRFEDLLFGAQFSDCVRVEGVERPLVGSRALGELCDTLPGDASNMIFKAEEPVCSLDELRAQVADSSLPGLVLAMEPEEEDSNTDSVMTVEVESGPTRLLVAGHDLKFIEPYFPDLEKYGFQISVDKWSGHGHHDEAASSDLLRHADVVLAEWCLGNAVWYSEHVRPEQRLVTRVHLQELYLPYLERVRRSAVYKYVFVNELYRKAAVVSHGIPDGKTDVIPNIVGDCKFLPAGVPRDSGAHRMGLVGIVPERKRLDVALDVLELVLQDDPRAQLVVKGKLPRDYPWMLEREDEMRYYAEQFARVDRLLAEWPNCVVFDGYSADIAPWYGTLSSVVSVSDFESFHFTIADGAAAGCQPGLLYWPGAEYSYPLDWVSASSAMVADRLLHPQFRPEDLSDVIRARYGVQTVIKDLAAVLRGVPRG